MPSGQRKDLVVVVVVGSGVVGGGGVGGGAALKCHALVLNLKIPHSVSFGLESL